jgi:5-formyltetrahydrofolate cyclo-ligase
MRQVSEFPASGSKAAARAISRRRRSERRAVAAIDSSTVIRIAGSFGVDTTHGSGLRIAAYSSYGHEPSTDSLIPELLESGTAVVLPRIAGDRLEWIEVTASTTFTVNDRGIREPLGPDRGLNDVDVVLVPALAATHGGHRLGQGGGYYDRALADVPRLGDGGPLLLAVVFADEAYDEPIWMVDDHDIRMDAIVTIDVG